MIVCWIHKTKFMHLSPNVQTCSWWAEIYPGLNANEELWKHILSLPYERIWDTQLQTVQCKIIHRLITYNVKLKCNTTTPHFVHIVIEKITFVIFVCSALTLNISGIPSSTGLIGFGDVHIAILEKNWPVVGQKVLNYCIPHVICVLFINKDFPQQ